MKTLHVLHALEMQAGPAPGALAALSTAPVEAVDDKGKALLAREPGHVGGLDRGILQMGRDDLEVLPIEGKQFKRAGRKHNLDLVFQAARDKSCAVNGCVRSAIWLWAGNEIGIFSNLPADESVCPEQMYLAT